MILKYAFHVCLSQPPLAFCLDSFIFKLIFFIWLINLVYHKPAFEGSHEPLSTIFRGLSITLSLFYTSFVVSAWGTTYNVILVETLIKLDSVYPERFVQHLCSLYCLKRRKVFPEGHNGEMSQAFYWVLIRDISPQWEAGGLLSSSTPPTSFIFVIHSTAALSVAFRVACSCAVCHVWLATYFITDKYI